MRAPNRPDLLFYLQALPLYARNLGVLLPPLIAAFIALGLQYASGWLFAPVGGAGDPLLAFIAQIVYGFAFGVSVIFADDAWRHGRASLASAWSEARRKAGNIFIAVLGFFFLIYVAQLIGGIGGSILSLALGALAVWAFIYAIAAAAIGGVPSSGAFSVSLQTARRHPLETAILTIVSLAVYYYVGQILPARIGPFLGPSYDVARVLLSSVALGYVALIVARQYAELAFRRFW